MQNAADRIIVALDVSSADEALRLVKLLADRISFFKIGLQLFTAAGPDLVREVLAQGAKVFLDLKLHDIPNTVARAVESAGALGVQMLTIHLSGGSEMISAAVAARSSGLALLGVTVLTSLDDEALKKTGVSDSVSEQVMRLAGLGIAAGVDGLVASAHELAALRAICGTERKIVVPGIRPAQSAVADQKRTMTPRAAIAAGADYLVIGRPVSADADPAAALRKIVDELV